MSENSQYLRLFFVDEEGEVCSAEELVELHSGECGEPATYMAEDLETGEQTMLCVAHKDQAKREGIAR